jgi:outer membrane protein assembly factor BamB
MNDVVWTSAPVIDETHVYVGYGTKGTAKTGTVAAFDAISGERAWKTTFNDDERASGFALDGDVLYGEIAFPERSETRVIALSKADGTVRWKWTLPTIIGSPAVVDGVLYFAGADNAVYAYDGGGTRRWRRRLDIEVETPVCVDDSVVYVGSSDGRMIALNAADGKTVWAASIVSGLAGRPDISGMPAVRDRTLYVPGVDRVLYAVSTADGSIEWTARLLKEDHGNPVASPAVTKDTAYAHTIHSGVVALDTDDGTERWRTGKLGAGISVAATEELIVAPKVGGAVVAFNTDGEQRWSFEKERPETSRELGGVIGSPRAVPAHEFVYVPLYDGLYALGAT